MPGVLPGAVPSWGAAEGGAPLSVLLRVHDERIAQVSARHRGGELERGDVRRRLRPAPLQLPAAGGREHGRPLLDVIPAQSTVQVLQSAGTWRPQRGE